MNYPVMRGDYLLMYEGRRYHDPDELRPDVRQAYCVRCRKLWQISRGQSTCPYYCPRCDKKEGGRDGRRTEDRE